MMNLFVYYVLFIGNIVKSGASELEMRVIFAELAFFHLKFIRNVP